MRHCPMTATRLRQEELQPCSSKQMALRFAPIPGKAESAHEEMKGGSTSGQPYGAPTARLFDGHRRCLLASSARHTAGGAPSLWLCAIGPGTPSLSADEHL